MVGVRRRRLPHGVDWPPDSRSAKKRPTRSHILYPFARLLVTLTLLFVPPLHAQDEIGFIESFVLASDRAEVLKQLIPGTEDSYYQALLPRLVERPQLQDFTLIRARLPRLPIRSDPLP